MPVNTKLQIRRGESGVWTSTDPALSQGEFGLNTNLQMIKVGDGSTTWTSQEYLSIPYSKIHEGSGISLSGLLDSNGQVTGYFIHSDIVAGDNITLTGGGLGQPITINGEPGITLSEGTGIHIVVNGDDHEINVSGLTSYHIGDFTEAAQDAIGASAGAGFLVNETGVAWFYDDAANTLAAYVTGIAHTLITDWDAAVSGSIEGNIDTQLIAGDGISFSYDSNNNSLTISTAVLDNAHTHIWDNISDAKLKATLSELGYLSGVVAGTTSASRALVVDSNKDLAGINDLDIDGTLTIGGNLTVNGTTTIVNSTEVDIGDNVIRLNVSGSAGEGGFQVWDHATNNSYGFVWDKGDSRWEFVTQTGSVAPNVYTSGNITASTLTSEVAHPTAPLTVTSSGLVINLNSDLLDGKHGSHYLDWNNFTSIPSPEITVSLTGDISGVGSATMTSLGDVTISIATTGGRNSIELGTDTTGDYVKTFGVEGTGLSLTSAGTGEGSTPNLKSNATSSNISQTLVARDASGGFSAGLVAATGFSGNGLQITNINASNISTGTLNEARLPSVSVSKTINATRTSSFIDSLSVDGYGRVTALTSGTHTLATSSTLGIASFSSDDFSVSAGAVTIKTGGVDNAQLANSSFTIGSTSMSLGSTYANIIGLTALSGTSTASPTYIYNAVIDGGTP